MRKALKAGLLLSTWATFFLAGSAGPALRAGGTFDQSPPAFLQNWFGAPCVPSLFVDEDPPGEGRAGLLDEPRPLPTEKWWVEAAPVSPPGESNFPKLLSGVLDMDEWRRQDDLKRIREIGGDLTFGIPLLIPQLLLEELIPFGVPVGPTTFLYRTGKDSRSIPLVVFDQALFHEGEFLAQVQAAGAGGPAHSVTTIEKGVLRRSLMNGFRASYALPNMSIGQVLETAADQGTWGYLLIPAAGAALVFLKGLDQKFAIDDFLKARVLVGSGRQWMHSAHAQDGVPVVSCELQFFDLPLSVILSMDMSSRGPSSQFVGLGTSLNVVQDLLGREETRTRLPKE